MMVRYCRRCDTEFLPHVVRCSDCDGELEDQYPDAATDDSRAQVQEETPDGEFVTVATDLSSGKAELVARSLGRAGIPFRIGAHGYGFVLAVRKQDQPATRQIPCARTPFPGSRSQMSPPSRRRVARA